MRPAGIALFTGAVSLALILGALGFQYIGDYQPCEMCHWQRWPHIAAAVIGLVGGSLVAIGRLDRKFAVPIAGLTILLVALSGALGVYHAGVEWKFWPGPSACTSAYVPGQAVDFTHMGHVPMCDRAAWRLFGISMAGYNALVSLGVAAVAALALSKRRA
ncbi:MAG TPA: disulfide bond formation protein B [Rhizomicrobium sp.]|jgi:disulfide bond formation protein DsbB